MLVNSPQTSPTSATTRLIVTASLAVCLACVLGPDAAAQTLKLYGGTFKALARASHERYDLILEVSGTPADGLDVLFGATSPRDHYRLTASKGRMTLTRVAGGSARTLTQAPLPQTQAATHELVIKRRPHFVNVLWDGQQALSALDSSLSKGICCGRVGGKATYANVRCQPLEPIVFSDGFMRTEEEAESLGTWEVVAGDWSMHSVLDRIRDNPDARIRANRAPEPQRSVNPFSLSGHGADGALIVNGHVFWDDYDVAVSAKTLGGQFGLVFDYRDGRNYHCLRWSLNTVSLAPGRVDLARVRQGRETVLGTRYVEGRLDNWYALRVRSVRGRIEAFIDHTLVLAAADPHAAGGRIGACAGGPRAAIFDDFSAESVAGLHVRSARVLDQARIGQQGQWSVADKDGTAWAACSHVVPAGTARYVFGRRDWREQYMQANMDTSKLDGSAGLVFGYQDDKHHWLGWVRPDAKVGEASVALVQVSAGQTRTVAQGKCDVRPGRCEIALDTGAAGAIRLYVNDRLELRAPVPAPVTGAVGFAAQGKGSARFGDPQLFATRDTDWESDVHQAIFVGDPYMQGWASRRWAWQAGVQRGDRQLYVHKGDFFGAFRGRIPVSSSFVLRFGEEDFAGAEAGYAFDVRFDDKTHHARLELRRAGKAAWTSKDTALPLLPPPQQPEVQEGAAVVVWPEPAPAYGPIVVCREGRYVWALAAGREVVSYRDPAPLRGRGMALVADAGFDLPQVDMKRDHVLDYLFEAAPTDWLKVGEWAVTNRFACDPRWSHLNGRSRGIAALWHKYGMEGDFTLECYAGMRMRQGDLKKGGRTSYPRVGDICLALCGDGQYAFSGYNFILAAWDKRWSERWTKLYRLDHVVAETDREFIPRTRDHSPEARVIDVEWDPGGRPIHGAWYFLKLRKWHNTLSLTFDGVPVLSYTDPKPLTGKHVALWTQDNSIVVARMKLSFARRDRQAARLVSKPKEAPSPAPAAPDDEISVSSLTHPCLVADFESHLEGWHMAHVDQGAVLSLVKRSDGKGQCLRLQNAYAGGDAGAEIPVQRMELSRVSRLEFDYRVDPGAGVNLYFQLENEAERFLFIHLTGPRDSSENMRRVASVAGAKADGQWRSARVDLAEALRQLEPGRSSFVLKRMGIGNWHEGYLNAGLGGNRAGATYYIDNFRVVGWGASGAVLEWEPTGEHVFTHYAWCVDRDPKTVPPDSLLTTDTLVVKDRLGAGVSYFHIKGKTPDGQWSLPAHYPLHVSGPLVVAAVSPAPGSRWGGEPVTVRFRRTGPERLLLADTALKLNGQPVSFNEHAFRYDPEKQELTLRLNQCGLAFGHDARVAFELGFRSALEVTPLDPLPKGASAASVQTQSGGHSWHYTMDHRRDKVPPGRVTTDKCLADHDFETTMPWSAYGGASGARLVRDTSTAASGEASVKLINHLVGGTFGATVLGSAFSAGQHPLVSFDYKADGSARADLRFTTGTTAVVEFTDNDTTYTRIGTVPNLRADGQWHHAAFDLKRMFDTAAGSYTPKLYSVRNVMFYDGGHHGNPPGVFFHIDNFRIGSVLRGNQPVSMALASTDLSGVAGYSYLWSSKPKDVPDKKLDTTGTTASFASLSEDKPYFHVMAQDRAGNWGPASHFEFVIDSTAPSIRPASPADGSTSAAHNVVLNVVDGGAGVDPSTYMLTMNGKRYSLSGAQTSYEPQSGRLSWDWVEVQSAMSAAIPDKTPMQMRIEGVKDFAGNPAPAVSWQWRVDYSKDKAGPPRPGLVRSATRPTTWDTFTSSTGTWRVSGRNTLERYFDPQRQDWCAKLTKGSRGWFWVYARRGYYYTSSYPMISFDYKLPKAVRIQMVVYYNGTWHGLEMTATGTYPPIGKIPGIVADGTWRHTAFNLHEIIAKAEGRDESFRPYYIAFTGALPNQNPEGATYYIDNFCIFGHSGPTAQFAWSARDATGITGASYAFDQKPDTVPDESIDSGTRTVMMPLMDRPGIWYCHLRVRDGAGNWGRAEHHPAYSTDPASPNGPDGLEANENWTRLMSGRRGSGTLGYLRTAGGKNTVASLEYRTPQHQPFHLRLHQPMDLSRARKLRLDLYHSHGQPVDVCLRLMVRSEWFTGKTQKISAAGWTRGVTFDLEGKVFLSPASRGAYNQALATPGQIQELRLSFTPHYKSGQLMLDAVRVE